MPAPSANMEPVSNRNEGTSSQKLMLLRRGNAMSGAPIIRGTNQLPKPPISAGMSTKKIMIRPCAVTMTLNRCGSPAKIWRPGCASSARIATDKAPPRKPHMTENTRYIVPMSLWLVE